MGLLSKASLITTGSKLAFSEFIITHNIKTFAVFQLQENYYSVINSIGFDGSSLLSTLSTKDFWDGVCVEERKVYSFTNDTKSINPMLQFFSFELMDEVKIVSVFKDDDKIYMICNKDFSSSITEDLNKIDYQKDYIDIEKLNKSLTPNTKLVKFEISFKEAVSNYLSIKGKDIPNIDPIKVAICNELVNRFSCRMSKYATKTIDSHTIRTIIPIDKAIQDQHLICHIVLNLRKVLYHTAEIVSFNNFGICNSTQDINDFLQV